MNKEKTNSRKENANITKNKIFKSAELLFNKYGIENVSVDSIVKNAGVSKGAFYVHYSSKYSLITELISNNVRKLDSDYRSYQESIPANATASEVFVSLAVKIAEIISFAIGYDHIKILYTVNLTGDVKPNASLDYNRELYKLFHEIISKGIKQGEFKKDLAIEKITKHCVMIIRGIVYEWCIRYPEFSLKDCVQEHFEIMLKGIKNNE